MPEREHFTVMAGLWAEFVRLDLAVENITGNILLFLSRYCMSGYEWIFFCEPKN